jgi:prepilin-type N-terminal cleavage/methylation domain-containing protein
MKPSVYKGFTLFELLIVISILAILMTAGITNWMAQIQRAYDAQRKGDLSKLKAVLEHYANDYGCYPPAGLMTCDSTIFASYNMPKVVCDPEAKQPYLYQPIDPSDLCRGYRLYTVLRVHGDTDIKNFGCDRPTGCGVPEHPEYNYGVAQGGSIVQ